MEKTKNYQSTTEETPLHSQGSQESHDPNLEYYYECSTGEGLNKGHQNASLHQAYFRRPPGGRPLMFERTPSGTVRQVRTQPAVTENVINESNVTARRSPSPRRVVDESDENLEEFNEKEEIPDDKTFCRFCFVEFKDDETTIIITLKCECEMTSQAHQKCVAPDICTDCGKELETTPMLQNHTISPKFQEEEVEEKSGCTQSFFCCFCAVMD
ncbi:hypothetical protein ACH5RR_031816 [Cinchona calisaya]|uniref:Uncharacterized protein n=1 Tax=Cinchona calisaya TaxID=153742 RepID=A0ABD2YJ24_9GENT